MQNIEAKIVMLYKLAEGCILWKCFLNYVHFHVFDSNVAAASNISTFCLYYHGQHLGIYDMSMCR